MDSRIFKFILNYHETFKKLLMFFEYDYLKLAKWFNAKNPNLGNARPIELILAGREEKLIKFIESALSENEL